ncbi:hypothetical protein AwDysgo_09470 [Bacteroidales bacterium]|nr:hypothetical protein AwDysgo_09470 [Bacteroidales bacterium]
MKRKILLVIALFLILTTGKSWAAAGDSAADPILIGTFAQLQSATGIKYYRLTASLVAAFSISLFRGHLDGDMHTITNSTGGSVFTQTNGGSIKNLRVTGNFNVVSSSNVGILVGTSTNTSFEFCEISGSLTLTGGVNVGGMVGEATGGSIDQCYSTANITTASGSNIGGLIGSSSATITNSYSTANITTASGSNIGGLVGSSSATITNSYATGDVTTEIGSDIGGLVGSSSATITNSYATGDVTGTISSSNAAGLVGLNTGDILDCMAANGSVGVSGNLGAAARIANEGTVTDCIANSAMTVNGSIVSTSDYNGTDKTSTELMLASTYSTSWGTGWAIFSGQTYPLLAEFLIYPAPYLNNVVCSNVTTSTNYTMKGYHPNATYSYTLKASGGGAISSPVAEQLVAAITSYTATTPKAITTQIDAEMRTYFNNVGATYLGGAEFTRTSTIGRVRPDPTADLIAADTTLCYGSNPLLDSARIKILLTGTAPFVFHYTKDGSSAERTATSGSLTNLGGLYNVDEFRERPNPVVEVGSIRGGAKHTTTLYNLDNSIKVTDLYACSNGVTSPLTRPDTVYYNPRPIVKFPYLKWHNGLNVQGDSFHQDTIVCNQDIVNKLVFESVNIDYTHKANMSFSWVWINPSFTVQAFGSPSRPNENVTAIGMIETSGWSSIPEFVAKNASDSVMKSYIRVTPYYTNDRGGRCAGGIGIGNYGANDDGQYGVIDFGITVNPTPNVKIVALHDTVCNQYQTRLISLSTQIKTGLDTVYYEWRDYQPHLLTGVLKDTITRELLTGNVSIFPSYVAHNNYKYSVDDSIRIRPYFKNRIICSSLYDGYNPDFTGMSITDIAAAKAKKAALGKSEITDTMTVIRIHPTTTIEIQPVGGEFCFLTKKQIFVRSYGSGLKHQWYFSANNNNNFEPLQDSISPYLVADRTGYYYMHIDSDCETRISDTILLKFGVAPIFYKNLEANVGLCEGSDYTFKVESDALAYQWYVDGDSVPGATSDSFLVQNMQVEIDYNRYSVLGTSFCDNHSSMSAVSRLWVVEPLELPLSFVDVPDVAVVGTLYKIEIGQPGFYGYTDATHYRWSFGNENAVFIKGEGSQLQATYVTFGPVPMSDTLYFEMSHPCSSGEEGGLYKAKKYIELVDISSGIDEVGAQTIAVYPNPVSDNLHIESDAAIVSVQVNDLNGRLIYSKSNIGQRELVLDASTWSKGSYLIKVITASDSRTHKLIKE